MKKTILCLAIFMSGSLSTIQASAANENLAFFLKSSLYGAGIGAGAGLVALTTSDRPSENLNTVARGASLGLYVGMAYGIYKVSQAPDQGIQAKPTILNHIDIAQTQDGTWLGMFSTTF